MNIHDDTQPDKLYGANPPTGYESKASRRALYQRRNAAKRQAAIEDLQTQIRALQNPPGCSFCRDLPGPYDLKYDCGQKFGLHIESDVVTCPECQRVLVHWD